MEPIYDRRVARTMERLGIAFTELLMEKNFDLITVLDLCERAGVRRATFYTHFKDKMDFTDFTVKAVYRGLGERVNSTLSAVSVTEYIMQFVRVGTELLISRRAVFLNIASSTVFPVICSMIAETAGEALKANIEAAHSRGLSIDIPADVGLTADFINAGIAHAVLNRLKDQTEFDASLYGELEKILKKLFETN